MDNENKDTENKPMSDEPKATTEKSVASAEGAIEFAGKGDRGVAEVGVPEITFAEKEVAPEKEAVPQKEETPTKETAPVKEIDPVKETAPVEKKGVNPMVIALVAAIAALVIGLAIGAFACKGTPGGGNTVAGKTMVSEKELSSEVASFTLNGKSEAITVKEVIEQTSSLEMAKDENGNYQVPSADSVLSVARNRVLIADAQNQGISVSDEDVAEYAEQQMGISDFATIAQNYGMDEATVKNLMRESCIMAKLRDKISGTQSDMSATMPNPPTEPTASVTSESSSQESASSSDSDESSSSESSSSESSSADTLEATPSASQNNPVTKEYADYIIALAGDEWDKTKGTWASTDGPYYQALSSYQITSEGASYEAATMAYYVAYQEFVEATSGDTEAWTEYVNGLLSKASIVIYTMMA